MGEDVKTAEITAECQRIEEDAEYSAKSHFDAAARWRRVHLWVGLPAAILAAIAGVSAFRDYADAAGAISIIVAALASVSTFLNPGDKASTHHATGNSYLALRNQARVFRTIELVTIDSNERAVARLLDFTTRRDDLNANSPQPPRSAFERARKGIEEGEAKYKVDSREKT